jgi:hypothetical protein
MTGRIMVSLKLLAPGDGWRSAIFFEHVNRTPNNMTKTTFYAVLSDLEVLGPQMLVFFPLTRENQACKAMGWSKCFFLGVIVSSASREYGHLLNDGSEKQTHAVG